MTTSSESAGGVEFDDAEAANVQVADEVADQVDVPSDAHSDAEQAPRQGALPLDVKTGDPRVDAAVSSLRDLDHMPVSDHADVFTQVHRDLQDALLTLDQG